MQLKVTFIQSSSSHAVQIADGYGQYEFQNLFYFCRDISKNAHLGFKPFLYWTILGFFHAFVFFYGSYLLMGEDTSLLGNGQVKIPQVLFYHCILLVFLSAFLKNLPLSKIFCFYELQLSKILCHYLCVLSRVTFLSMGIVRCCQKAYVPEDHVFQDNRCIVVVLNFVVFRKPFLSKSCFIMSANKNIYSFIQN